MSTDSRAGSPATAEDLVDVDALVARLLRPATPTPATPTSGSPSAPRATAARAAHHVQRGPHRWPPPGDRRVPRARRASTGPLFIGRDTHALSEPAWRTALEVLVANGVEVARRRRGRLHADARRSRTRSSPRNREAAARRARRRHRRSRRRTTRPPTAASSTTRRTAAPPTPTSPVDRRSGPTSCSRGGLDGRAARRLRRRRAARARRVRLPGHLRRRPAATSSTSTRSATPACASAPTRWAARQRRLLGRDRRAPRARPHRRQPARRPAVRRS